MKCSITVVLLEMIKRLGWVVNTRYMGGGGGILLILPLKGLWNEIYCNRGRKVHHLMVFPSVKSSCNFVYLSISFQFVQHIKSIVLLSDD
jgi:hypothetical protein